MVDSATNIVLEQQLSACAVIVLGDVLRAAKSAGMLCAAKHRDDDLKKVLPFWVYVSGFVATLGDTHCNRRG